VSRSTNTPVVFRSPADRRTGSPAHRLQRVTLVRHGETEGQSSIRYYGRTDVPLSPLGRLQMERVRAVLATRRFAAVYTSTLSRASEAARIISETAGGTALTPVLIAGFDEIDFGEWEGLTIEEIRDRYPRLYIEWEAHRGGDFTYPGGESTRGLRERVACALHEVLAQAPSGELLFVLHKGVIRCILAELLGYDETQRRNLIVALGSIHVITCNSDGWSAEALDRTEHL
jgi:broad specificity phosphatase PhoE